MEFTGSKEENILNMRYFFTVHRNIVNENQEKIKLDEPFNLQTIAFIQWQSEGGTIEESEFILPEEMEQIFNEQISNFLIKKKEDGSKYFDEMECKITTQLFGMERTELMALLVEMQTILYPPLNLIRGGDFASALALFQQTPGTSKVNVTGTEIILSLWNEARGFTMRYYLENYPR
ncbi:MAG: hypothetical protein ACOH1X_02815 [Kaistella sp.]